jgi:hypothetical protein
MGPTPDRVLRLAEGLVKTGFPPDVGEAVDTLRRYAAADPMTLEGALQLARQQSQLRRSKLLVVELLHQAWSEPDPGELGRVEDDELVIAGAD